MSRGRLAALGIVLLVALAPTARASEPAAAPPPAATTPGATEAAPTPAIWGDGKVPRGSRPTATPAKGAPYNLRQMGLAAIIMGLMALFVVWLVRRHTRERG